MIDIRMARRKTVVWVIFTAVVTVLDLVKLREAGAVVIHAQGDSDVILDFSGATLIDVSDKLLETHGAEPPHAPHKVRVMVAPAGRIREQALLYAQHQVRNGFKPPTIVSTIEQALNMVGCRKGEFVPIDTRWLDEVEAAPGRVATPKLI